MQDPIGDRPAAQACVREEDLERRLRHEVLGERTHTEAVAPQPDVDVGLDDAARRELTAIVGVIHCVLPNRPLANSGPPREIGTEAEHYEAKEELCG